MSKKRNKQEFTGIPASQQSNRLSQSQDTLLAELELYQVELEMQNEQLRQSQLELEKSRDHYVDFYDFAPVGYLTLSNAGAIDEINLTGAALLGVERSKLLGRRFSSLVADEDRERWHRHFLYVLRSDKKTSCKLLMLQINGVPFHARLDCLCMTRPNSDAKVRIVLTDISESLYTKDALRESEQKFRTLTDAMPQMVWIANPKGLNSYFSQQWVDYTGVTLDKSYGLNWFDVFHPEDRQRAKEAWQLSILNDSIYSLESRLRRADGLYRWWLVRAVARHDEAGSVINWFGTCTDITAQKDTEGQLLESLRKLEEKERAKTRFLAAAGHDLRQPVAAAGLFVYALKHTNPTSRQRELIEKLSQSMNAFSELLKQLLDISKFDAGAIKPQISTFDLADLCEWLENSFASTAHEKQLRFHLYFSTQKPLLVKSDIALLRSLLMNLLSNAIKFTAQGGILISARPRGERVLIQVWDTGIGISKTDMPLVFDEFYQVGNVQRSRDAGLGLGLSICQRAMSLLGGKVVCRSRLGSGSVFEFSLPLKNERREAARLPEVPDDQDWETRFQGKRVVVLEDDELVSAGMVSLLQEVGADVLHYDNAETALKQEDIDGVDYFIVDYALSGPLDGIEFLGILQNRLNQTIRAVVVTGETSSRFISSVDNCPWPVLYKPVDFSKLADALTNGTIQGRN